MDQFPLVGRQTQIQKLLHMFTQSWNFHGTIVFIEGAAGIGKTTLLKMLQQQTSLIPEVEKTDFIYGFCYESTGTQSAYQPFIDIFETLTKVPTKRKNVGLLTLDIIKETAPDWLQIVPVVGAALGAGMKSATMASQWFLDSTTNTEKNQPTSLINQYVNSIIKVALQQKFLVLVIEDAHWIDDASCQLLLRLAKKIVDKPLVVLVTYRANYLTQQHPLKKVLLELVPKNLAQNIQLTGLSEEQIQSYILKRFKSTLHPKLALWLEHLCKGNPLFTTQYLSLLEQENIIQQEHGSYVFKGDIRYIHDQWKIGGALATIPIPYTLEAVLQQRIERLLEEDQELLQLGAVQGDFMSLLLAELLSKKEIEVLARLRQIVERQHIVSIYAGEEWLKRRSEFYMFEHHLMQQAFYNKLSPRERTLHHYNVAQFLEKLFKEQKKSSLRLILEVAYHYSQGDEPLLSAHYSFIAAQTAFVNGAFVETIDICKTSREHFHKAISQDKMLAEVILLLLTVSENRLQGKLELQSDIPLKELASEAEAVARYHNDLALVAQFSFSKAKLFSSARALHMGLRSCARQ